MQKLRKKQLGFTLIELLIVVIIVAVLAAPLAIPLLYGDDFSGSVAYVQALFVFAALFGLGVGLGPMWRALNKVNVSIFINISVLTVGIPSGIWLLKAYGLTGAVIMITAWYTVSHAVSFAYLYRKLGA